jgi:dephospho-CoA kinase
VLAAIAERFGGAMLDAAGTLDRDALRRAVVGDDDALASLNAIVHPAVQRRRDELHRVAEQHGDLIVVNDIPLLFEVLDPEQFDTVVLIDAPEPVRRSRLTTLRGMPDDEADRLIASQQPSSSKRPRSQFVIDNVTSLDDLEKATWEIWCTLRREAAKKSAPRGGRLLAMFAHPDDETFAIGGTLARYADAGVEVHLWCATAGEAGTLHGERVSKEQLRAVRTEELYRVVEILGIHELHLLDFPDGGLDPSDPSGHAAATDVLQRLRPDIVVTFGRDGVTGHADHLAVHEWTDRAWTAAGLAGQRYYVTYPEDVAAELSSRLAGRPIEQITACLDVRPWQDVKRAAIEGHASQRFPFALDGAPGKQLLEREWFAGGPGGPVPLGDFFGETDPA